MMNRIGYLFGAFVAFSVAAYGLVQLTIPNWQLSERVGGLETSLLLLGAAFAGIIAYAWFGWVILQRFFPAYKPWLHPPLFLTVWFLALYMLPALLVVIDPNLLKLSFPLRRGAIIQGWLLTLIGFAALWVGYGVGIAGMRHDDRPQRPLPDTNLLMVLYVFTLVIRFVALVVEGYGYGRNPLAWGPVGVLFDNTLQYLEMSFYLVLVILYVKRSQQQRDNLLFLAVLAIEILFAMAAGFSSRLVFLLAALFATAYYLGDVSFRPRHWLLLALGLMMGVGIVPVTETLRANRAAYQSTSVNSLLAATSNAIAQSWGRGLGNGLEIFEEKFIARQTDVSVSVGIVASRTPDVAPYLGGMAFAQIPLYVVPRFIWTDKPVLTRGPYYNVTYFQRPDTGTSMAVTIFGEAYTYFGLGSLVLGLFGFGALLGGLFRLTMARGVAVIFLALIPSYIHIEGQLSVLTTAIIQNALVYFLLYGLLMLFTEAQQNYRQRSQANAPLEQNP